MTKEIADLYAGDIAKPTTVRSLLITYDEDGKVYSRWHNFSAKDFDFVSGLIADQANKEKAIAKAREELEKTFDG